jgi:hypothetical protein
MTVGRRSWRDPFTGKEYLSLDSCADAVAHIHADQLKALKVTPLQLLYNSRNRLPLVTCSGRSVLSGKPTAWNERAGRYERFADEEEKAIYRKIFLDRMHVAYGKDHLLDDPDQQRKMLAARSISGVYAFADGTQHVYTGKEELALLEFFDLGLRWPGVDIECPAPQNFKYIGPDKEEHWYIPDAYLSSLNLIIEVKGEQHNGWRDREKEIEHTKDVVLGTSGYRYVKVVSQDWGELLDAIAAAKREEEG